MFYHIYILNTIGILAFDMLEILYMWEIENKRYTFLLKKLSFPNVPNCCLCHKSLLYFKTSSLLTCTFPIASYQSAWAQCSQIIPKTQNYDNTTPLPSSFQWFLMPEKSVFLQCKLYKCKFCGSSIEQNKSNVEKSWW